MANRTGKRITESYFEENGDTWGKIREDYDKACMMSCKPGPEFRKLKPGDVIDEEKSVRWNREEVERLNKEYKEEFARLTRERGDAINKCTERAIAQIAEETGLSKEKAEILWNFVYERYHAFGEMFTQIDDYIMLVNDLLD